MGKMDTGVAFGLSACIDWVDGRVKKQKQCGEDLGRGVRCGKRCACTAGNWIGATTPLLFSTRIRGLCCLANSSTSVLGLCKLPTGGGHLRVIEDVHGDFLPSRRITSFPNIKAPQQACDRDKRALLGEPLACADATTPAKGHVAFVVREGRTVGLGEEASRVEAVCEKSLSVSPPPNVGGNQAS